MPARRRLQHFEVVLTAGCNLSCGYCYQNDKRTRRMHWDTLRATADRVLEARDATLLFIGGEPLLEFPLLRRAVRYIEERRALGPVRYEIITNGTLLREEQAAFLVEHDFDVQLSFDGVPAAQDLRGPGTFAVLDRLLDRLLDRHPRFFASRLTVAITVVPQTIRFLADSVEYFLGKDVRRVMVSPATTYQPAWNDERMADLDAQFARIFDASLTHRRRTGRVPLALFAKSEGPEHRAPRSGPTCAAGRGAKAAVDVDGHAYGCVMFVESYQRFPTAFLRSRLEGMRLGDVRDRGFARRFAAYPAAARETGLFHDKRDKYSSYARCGECRFIDTCSVCPVSIAHVPGHEDPRRIPDFQCGYHLVALKYRERFPQESFCLPSADAMPEPLRAAFLAWRPQGARPR